MRFMLLTLSIALVSLTGLVLPFATISAFAAALPAGERTISLLAPDGRAEVIGRVSFTADGEASKISVVLDGASFSEEFLSMRPFRCIAGEKRMWCHLEYPYENAKRITSADLTDLEYALMFLWRTYDKVSIDAWNGLYYKLKLDDDGTIRGDLHEVDFNPLASPPPTGVMRPIAHTDLTPASSGQHLFNRLEIK